MAFLMRWFGAFVLLALTWNPTPWNYSQWVLGNYDTQTPLAVLLGLVLLVIYIVYLTATLRSIGPFGMFLVAAIFAALIWVLIDWGVLQAGDSLLNQWLGLVAASLVLGIGLSWSILWRRLSGQADVDDVDD